MAPYADYSSTPVLPQSRPSPDWRNHAEQSERARRYRERDRYCLGSAESLPQDLFTRCSANLLQRYRQSLTTLADLEKEWHRPAYRPHVSTVMHASYSITKGDPGLNVVAGIIRFAQPRCTQPLSPAKT